MEGSEQMRRLGEDAQEAFASGNPDTLGESEDELMEVCNSTAVLKTLLSIEAVGRVGHVS